MCYDISFSTVMKTLKDYFPDIVMETQLSVDFENKDHVLAQAFSKYPVIVFQEGKFRLREMEWGVIAAYMDTPDKIKQGRQWMCNAQAEKVAEKSSYWHRIRKSRCLIPVTGIYEHREVTGLKNKIPYYVWQKKRSVFFLPGLFAPYTDKETGEIINAFTVITRGANSVMKQIHNGGSNKNRMPLFLNFELEQKWVMPDLTDEELLEIMKFEIPSETLDFRTVFTIRGRSQRPDGLKKIEEYNWGTGVPEIEV
ncbi:MAG: SOS response-associated peptidase [Chitinophagales bacterium]